MPIVTNSERRLGSQLRYVIFRLNVVITMVLVCTGFYFLGPFSFFLVSLGLANFGLLAMELKDPMAHGYADGKGLHYRRYLKWRNAAWDEVEDIEWRALAPSGVILFFKHAPGRPRQLKFLMSRSALRRVPSSDDPTPEIVLWIRERIKFAGAPSPDARPAQEWQQNRPIGSFGKWLYRKSFYLAGNIFILVTIPFHFPPFVATFCIVVIFLFIWFIETSEPVAYGYTNEKGLFFGELSSGALRGGMRWKISSGSLVEGE